MTTTIGNAGGKIAYDFARALVDGDFAQARSMLSPDLQRSLTAFALRWKYGLMVFFPRMFGGPATHVEITQTLDSWPTRQPNDLGWFYVSISNQRSWAEAVAVVVTAENGTSRIRAVEWGRP